jgi:hypothetical protein
VLAEKPAVILGSGLLAMCAAIAPLMQNGPVDYCLSPSFHPNAEQIRQYIATLTDFAGVDGIYDFKTNTERGLGPDSAIVVRYDAKSKAWVWLAKPGGAPLE